MRALHIAIIAACCTLVSLATLAQEGDVPLKKPIWTQVFQTADGTPVAVGDTLVLQGFPVSGSVYSEGMLNLIALRKDANAGDTSMSMDIRMQLLVTVWKNPDYSNYSSAQDYDSLLVVDLEVGSRQGGTSLEGLEPLLDVKTDDAFMDKSVREVMAVVQSIEVNTGEGYEYAEELPKDVYMELSLGWSGLKSLSIAEAPALQISRHSCEGQTGSDIAEVTWDEVTDAVEYQLEWCYRDNYRVDNDLDLIFISPTAVRYDFRRDATRIITTATRYLLPIIYDRGVVALRVRALGRDVGDPTLITYGPWSETDDSGPVGTLATSDYLVIDEDENHEPGKNWQVTSSYAEEGRHKEVMTYADGTTRARQTVTWSSTLQLPIIKEDFYDALGRAAVEVMPVPMVKDVCDGDEFSDDSQWAPIAYYEEFNNAVDDNISTGHTFTYRDLITGSGGECAPAAGVALDDDNGAEFYYNPNSLTSPGLLQAQSKFLPRANGYPYAQTEYMPDHTGRVKRKGGVGLEYQLSDGADHATRFIYGAPEQVKLDRLFGSEAPYASQCQRNITTDANGQATATYLDGSGHTIATALVAGAPEGMEDVQPWTSILLEEDLFGGQPSGASDHNHFDQLEGSFTYDQPFVVPVDGALLRFTHTLTIPPFEDECLDGICYHCVYDLEVTVTDAECGTLVYQRTEVVGAQGENGAVVFTCAAEPAVDPWVFGTEEQNDPDPDLTEEFFTEDATNEYSDPLLLKAGTFILHKKLKINQAARDAYAAHYATGEGLLDACYDSFAEIQADQEALIDLSSCTTSCQECISELGPVTDFILDGRGTAEQWQNLYDECNAPCAEESWCTIAYTNMLSDMRPNGQYAKYHWDTDEDPPSVVADDLASIFLPIVGPTALGIREQPDLPVEFRADKPAWQQPRFYPNDDPDQDFEPRYVNADGSDARIYVTPVQDAFVPAVVDDLLVVEDEYGMFTTVPENLEDVEDFLFAYLDHPEWARSLVYLHPEYCYYKDCRQYGEVQPGETLSSDAWDALLRGDNLYSRLNVSTLDGPKAWIYYDDDPSFSAAAQRTALMPPTGYVDGQTLDRTEIPSTPYDNTLPSGLAWQVGDPFLLAPTNDDAALELADRYFNYFYDPSIEPSGYLSMPQFAALLARCGGLPAGGTFESICGDFGNPSVAESMLEKEWTILKAIYLAEKYRIQKRYADLALSSSDCNWCQGLNQCIGEEDHYGWQTFMQYEPVYRTFSSLVTPQVSATAPYYQGTCEPCANAHWLTYDVLLRKVRRVAEPVPDPLALDPDQTAAQVYLQTGMCPLAIAWSALLNEVMGLEDWRNNTAIDLPGEAPTYFGVQYHLPETLAVLDATWQATTAGDGTVTATITLDGEDPCSMTLDPPDGFDWDDLMQVVQINVLNDNGFFTLTALALVDDDVQTVQIQGHLLCDGLIDLYHCTFPPTCDANALGQALQTHLNAMAGSGAQFSGNLAAALPVPLPAVVDLFEPYGYSTTYPPAPDVEYSFDEIWFTLQFTDVQNYGGNYNPGHWDIALTDWTTTGGGTVTIAVSALNDIWQFVNLRSEGGNSFVVDLLNTDQLPMGSLHGTATWCANSNTCGPSPLGSCPEATLPACADEAHSIDDDLAAVVAERLLYHTLGQAFSTWSGDGEMDLFASSMMTTGLRNVLGPLACPTCQVPPDQTPFSLMSAISGPVDDTWTLTFPLEQEGCSLTVDIELPNGSSTTFDNLGPFALGGYDTNTEVYHELDAELFDGTTAVGSITITANCLEFLDCPPVPCPDPALHYPPEVLDPNETDTTECYEQWLEWHTWAVAYNASDYVECRMDGLSVRMGYAEVSYHMFRVLGLCHCLLDENGQINSVQQDNMTTYAPPLACNASVPEWVNYYRQLVHVEEGIGPPVFCGNQLSENDPCVQAYANYLSASDAFNAVDGHPAIGNVPFSHFIEWGWCSCADAYVTELLNCIVTDPLTQETSIDEMRFESSHLSSMTRFCSSAAPCPPPPFVIPPPILPSPEDPCEEGLQANADLNAQHLWEVEQGRLRAQFLEAYNSQCMQAVETFAKHFKDEEHHYTLYYYDQAGNLIRTVPPEGVEQLAVGEPGNSQSMLNQGYIAADRLNGTRSIFTQHRLSSEYTFNSLNNPVKVLMPDQDAMKVWDAALPTGLPTDITITGSQFTGGGTGFLSGYRTLGSTRRGYVFRTHDAGNTWERCTGTLGSRLNNSFFFNATNAFAVGEQGTFIRSVNGGSTWDRPAMDPNTPANNLDGSHSLRDLHFIDDSKGWVAGSTPAGGALLRRTANGGTTGFDAQLTLFNADFGAFNALTGWGNNLVGVGTTTDGLNGLWVFAANGDQASPTWKNPVSEPLIKSGCTAADLTCVAAGGGGGVWAGGTYGTLLNNSTTNIDATSATPWRTIATNTTDDILDLWFLNAEDGIALFQPAGTNQTELRYTNDGGEHWTVFCTEGHINALFPYQVTGTEGLLVAVGDNGQWMQLAMHAELAAGYIPHDPIPGAPHFLSVTGQFIDANPDKLHLFLGGANGELWRCPDALAIPPVFTHTLDEGFASQAITRMVLHAYDSDQYNLVLLAGNASGSDENWRTASYVPSTNTYTQNTAQLYSAQHAQALTALPNGRALLFDRVAGRTASVNLDVASPASSATASATPTTIVGTVPAANTFDVTAMAPVSSTSVVMAGPAVDQLNTHVASLHTLKSTSATAIDWCDHVRAIRPLPLYDLVDGLSDGSMVACGEQGSFFEHPAGADADVWRAVPTRFTTRLEGVAYHAGNAELVAVGAGGLVIRGSTGAPDDFVAVTTPATVHLHDVVLDGDAATVAGDAGTIWYSDDYTNAPFEPATSANVDAVRGLARTATSGEVCAVGDHALLHRVMGTARMPVVDLFTPELLDLHFTPDGDGYVSGASSTLLHTPDGGLHWNRLPLAGADAVTLAATAHDGPGKALAAGTYLVSGTITPYFKSITGEAITGNVTVTGTWAQANIVDIAVNATGSALAVGSAVVSGSMRGLWISRETGSADWVAHPDGSGAPVYTSLWSWPRYLGNDDYAVGCSDGTVRLIQYANGGGFTAGSYFAATANNSPVRALWFHDRVNGLATAHVGADAGLMYRLTVASVDHNSNWSSTSDEVAPAYHGDLLGQTTVSAMKVNTIAFSDRTHGFVGGVYGGSPTWFARTVVDDAGLQSQRLWYDPLGRLVFSQNTLQYDPDENPATTPTSYSYTTYDGLSRPVEAGQVTVGTSSSTPFSTVLGATINGAYNPTAIDLEQVPTFLSASGNARTEVTATQYDEALALVNLPVAQDNLRLRVASTTFEQTYDGDPLKYDHATHYSYDIHGNVKQLVQDIPELNLDAGLGGAQKYTGPHRYKTLHYTYGLVSGNVNTVNYQRGRLEQWIHSYQYDADNRITEAHVGANDLDMRRIARYTYYAHGPLRRVELDEAQQGLDYAYTLQGWIKGMNSEALFPANDMGGDAAPGTPQAATPVDAFGYSLTYNASDYTALDLTWNSTISANFLSKPGDDIETAINGHQLWNGNIAKSAFTLPPRSFWDPHAGDLPNYLSWVYGYDQLNRLVNARATDLMDASNDWSGIPSNLPNALYKSLYAYDANGNITAAGRYDHHMDQYDTLSYFYQRDNNALLRNRLYHLQDAAADNVVDPSDPADQGVTDLAYDLSAFTPGLTINGGANNYRYDPLGNLIADKRERIDLVKWTVAGKVASVTHTAASGLKNLVFGYGADGQRIRKEVRTSEGALLMRTWYLRDAQGNIMATYEHDGTSSLRLTERHLYGSEHLGLVTGGVANLYGLTSLIAKSQATPAAGKFFYELKDHLGNVAVVITADRFGVDQDGNGSVDFYVPKVTEYHGYEPFGSLLPGRNYSAQEYNYGFNGQLKDNEIYNATGTAYAAEFWEYDTRAGRRWNMDPVDKPWISPYHAFSNKPILNVDPNGANDTKYQDEAGKLIHETKDGSDAVVTIANDKIGAFKKALQAASNPDGIMHQWGWAQKYGAKALPSVKDLLSNPSPRPSQMDHIASAFRGIATVVFESSTSVDLPASFGHAKGTWFSRISYESESPMEIKFKFDIGEPGERIISSEAPEISMVTRAGILSASTTINGKSSDISVDMPKLSLSTGLDIQDGVTFTSSMKNGNLSSGYSFAYRPTLDGAARAFAASATFVLFRRAPFLSRQPLPAIAK